MLHDEREPSEAPSFEPPFSSKRIRGMNPEKQMRRGQVNPRSWDAAIRAVQRNLLEWAASVPLTDEQDRILTTAFLRCDELTARKHLAWFSTNRELAAKYGVSVRTVTVWARAMARAGLDCTATLCASGDAGEVW
jgi:hypothetical protein